MSGQLQKRWSVRTLKPISQQPQPTSPMIAHKTRGLLRTDSKRSRAEGMRKEGVKTQEIDEEPFENGILSPRSDPEKINEEDEPNENGELDSPQSPVSDIPVAYNNPFHKLLSPKHKKTYTSGNCEPQGSNSDGRSEQALAENYKSAQSPKSLLSYDIVNLIEGIITNAEKPSQSIQPLLRPEDQSMLSGHSQTETQKAFYKILFKELGDFLYRLSDQMMTVISEQKITFEEIKTQYCWNILSFMLDICRAHDMSSTHNSVHERSRMMNEFNQQTRKIFEFLEMKFAPLKNMGSVEDCNTMRKVADVNKVHDVSNDILINCGMGSKYWAGKHDYSSEIKTFINKLIRQSRKQHPIFLQTMQGLMENDFDDDDDQSSCTMELQASLMDSTELYTYDQIKAPGLKLKSGELLRILTIWTNQLFSNFGNPEEVILDRVGGFKSLHGQGFNLTKRRRVALADVLKQIYKTKIKPRSRQRSEVLNSLLVDLLSGILKGYRGHQGLNSKQVMVAKLSQYLYECLQADLCLALNEKITMLASVREKYDSDFLESHIDLVTFNLMDLLKCKITGSKAQINRAYKRILANKGYYEIVQLKNRMGTPYNDLLIHLKLADSFLICQIQLILGDTRVKLSNNYLPRVLHDLRISRFPVAYQCASSLIQLDPSINYFDTNHPVEFVGYVLDYSVVEFKDETLYCSNKHNPTKMNYLRSHLPFWCKACKVFFQAYSFGPQFLRCSQCLLTICPKCMLGRWSQFQGVFLKKYTNIAFMREFLEPEPLLYGFFSNAQLEQKAKKLIQPKGYLVLMQYDCHHVKLRIVKKVGDKLIDGFLTMRDIPKAQVTNSKYNWCTILKLRNIVTMKLNSIETYQKVQIGRPWHDIQQILEDKNVSQVVICHNNRKIALLIDLTEDLAAIKKTLADMELEEMLIQQNEKEQIYLQLSSRNIPNMNTINELITNKQNVRLINLWQNKLQNAQKLVQYPKLNQLYLRQNFISDIRPLLKLTTLLHLNLQRNELSGKFPAISFPNLKSLDISCNRLLDVSELGNSELSSLATLLIGVNRITELPILKCPKLDTLYFPLNGITNLNNLQKSELPMIQKIHGCKNRLRGKLPALAFPMLSVLWLHDNFIEDISEFTSIPMDNFQWLRVTNNSIKGEIPVFEMPNLLNLELQNNQITDINNLTKWKTPILQTIVISSNQVQGQLPILNFSELKQLNLSRNTLGSIDNIVSCNINKIQELDLSHNQIYGPLPILKFPKLSRLNLQMNRFDDARPLQRCILPALQFMDISQNHIRTSIPILQLQNLNEIRIAQNSIRSLFFLKQSQLVPKLKSIIVHPSELVLLPQQQAKLRTYILKDAFLEKRKALERKRLQIQRV